MYVSFIWQHDVLYAPAAENHNIAIIFIVRKPTSLSSYIVEVSFLLTDRMIESMTMSNLWTVTQSESSVLDGE